MQRDSLTAAVRPPLLLYDLESLLLPDAHLLDGLRTEALRAGVLRILGILVEPRPRRGDSDVAALTEAFATTPGAEGLLDSDVLGAIAAAAADCARLPEGLDRLVPLEVHAAIADIAARELAIQSFTSGVLRPLALALAREAGLAEVLDLSCASACSSEARSLPDVFHRARRRAGSGGAFPWPAELTVSISACALTAQAARSDGLRTVLVDTAGAADVTLSTLDDLVGLLCRWPKDVGC